MTSAYEVSESSMLVPRYVFVYAANSYEKLSIVFPDGKGDLNAIQNGFQAKSTHGLLRWWVGCIDGLHIEIRYHSKEKCRNIPN